MLELTESAVEAVQILLAASPEIEDESGGLRVTSTGESFQLGVAALPDEEDEVVEAEGARVFLEPDAAAELDDKVLDARVEDDEFAFMIAPQAES